MFVALLMIQQSPLLSQIILGSDFSRSCEGCMLCTVVGTFLMSYWFKSLFRSYSSVTRWWILWVAYLNLTCQGQTQILSVFFINISKYSLAIWTDDLDFFFPSICQKPDLNSTPFATGGFCIIVSDSQLKFWNVARGSLFESVFLCIIDVWCFSRSDDGIAKFNL